MKNAFNENALEWKDSLEYKYERFLIFLDIFPLHNTSLYAEFLSVLPKWEE